MAFATIPASAFTVSTTSPTAHEPVVSTTTSNGTKSTEPSFGTTTTFQFGPAVSSTLGQGHTLYGVSTLSTGSRPSFGTTSTSSTPTSLGSAHPPFQHASTTVSGSSSKSTLSFSTTSNGTSSTLGVSTAPAFVTISSSGPSTTTSSLGVSTAPAFAFPPPTTTSSLGVSNAPAFAFPPSTTTSSLGVSTAPAFAFFPPSTTTSSLGVSTASAFATIPSFPGPSTTLPFSSTMSSTFGVTSVSSTSGESASLFSRPGFGTKGGGDKFFCPVLFPGPGFVTNGGDEKIISISATGATENKSHEELRWEDYQQKGFKGSTLTPFCQHSSTTGATNFDQSAGQNGKPCVSTNTCCLHSPGSFPPASIHVFVNGATNAHAANEATGATIAHATSEAWRQSPAPSGHSNMITMSVPLMVSGQNSFPGMSIMVLFHPVVYNGQTAPSFSALPSSASSFSMANCSNSSAAGSNGQVVDCKFCQNGNQNQNQSSFVSSSRVEFPFPKWVTDFSTPKWGFDSRF